MFTPLETAAGGLLLFAASATLLGDTGRVLGVSGILEGALWSASRDFRKRPDDVSGAATPAVQEAPTTSSFPGQSTTRLFDRINAKGEASKGWRRAVLEGMLIAPLVAKITGLEVALPDQGLRMWEKMAPTRLAFAGLLVGIGMRLGSGCTSGHMLCGLSRFHSRSIAATLTFLPIAILTANLLPAIPPLPAPFPPSFDLSIPSSYLSLLPPIQHLPYLILPLVAFAVIRITLAQYLVSHPNASPQFKRLPYMLSGLVFGLGLQVSGMANPAKVLGFLTFPNWETFDPSLMLVLLFGVIPNALHWYLLNKTSKSNGKKPSPRYPWEKWSVPTRKDIDLRLIGGAAVFGIGWGLAGVCPGPAVVGVGAAMAEGAKGLPAIRGLLTFGTALLTGMGLSRFI